MKRQCIFFTLILIPLFLIALPHTVPSTSNTRMSTKRDGVRSWQLMMLYNQAMFGRLWNYYYYPPINTIYPDSVISYPFNTWGPYYSTVFTYDANHEYVQEVICNYVIPGQSIEPKFQMSLIYNDDHHLTDYTFRTFNTGMMQFLVTEEWHYFYSGQILTSYLYITYNPNPNYYKGTYQYDDLGRETDETTQWSSDSTNWHDDTAIHTTYHQSDTTTADMFADDLAHGKTFSLIFHTPISNAKYLEIRETSIDIYDYRLYWHSIYSYDTQNRISLNNEEAWNLSEMSWDLHLSRIYYYDDSNNVQQVYNQNFTMPNVDWSEYYLWELSTDNEDPSVPTPSTLVITAYPNPFQQNVGLNISSKSNQPIKVDIFNLKGQLVYSATAQSNTNLIWNAEKASSGMYIIRAMQGTQTQTRKIIRVK